MDLQTRKLNLITFLAQIHDEIFIEKIENFIINKSKPAEFSPKPFTVEELISRSQKSDDDYKSGRYKSQAELEEISENW